MNSIEKLADHIKSLNKDDERFVIAITGFGGAGKSTVSSKLSTILGNTTLIHTDDFIASDKNGALEGYHLDWGVLNEVLKSARVSNDMTSKIYDWKTNKSVEEKIKANKYVIFEGSLWLLQDELKDKFDLTVWINVPQIIANQRGKKRDNEEYGVDHDELWDMVWSPREADSFNKLRPDKNADILFENNFN